MKKKQPQSSPAETLRRLGRWGSMSIGQMESLSGLNIQSYEERKALWDRFRHLYTGDSQTLFKAVMDHCATITLQRIARGELSLLSPRH